MAGGLLAIPINGKSQSVQLGAHLIDVAIGPVAWIHIALDRRIFRWQTEGIPAHRMQHGLAAHALHPGNHVGDHIIAHMAHVQSSRWIGEHRKGIEALLVSGFVRDV